MKIVILITFSCVIINFAYGAEHKRITIDQAQMLASVAATLKRYPSPKILPLKNSGYSEKQINSIRFINFLVIYPNNDFPDGNGADNYIVDFYTGDVFQPPSRNFCAYSNDLFDEVKTKKLEMLQKKVRRTLHLTHAIYQRLKTKRPECKDLSSHVK